MFNTDHIEFQLRKGDGQERKILHICFYTWHDKGTPERPSEMLYLVSDINYNRKLFIDEAEKSGWLKGGRYVFDVYHPLVLSEIWKTGLLLVYIAVFKCFLQSDIFHKL